MGKGFPAREMYVPSKGRIALHSKEKGRFPAREKVLFKKFPTKGNSSLKRQNGKLFPDGISNYSETYSPLQGWQWNNNYNRFTNLSTTISINASQRESSPHVCNIYSRAGMIIR